MLVGYSFILCRSQKKLENVMCKRRRVHGSAEVLLVASKQPMWQPGSWVTRDQPGLATPADQKAESTDSEAEFGSHS